MKLRFDVLVTRLNGADPASQVNSKVVQLPVKPATQTDGIQLSSASALLKRSAAIERVMAAVQDGTYQVSSTATSKALLEEVLSGR
jgi:anti-sigma28 factor (negative regulator of flagellin synthesis)